MNETSATNIPRKAEIGSWISTGWDWFARDWPMQIAIGFFAALLISVSSGILSGPVLAGLAICSLKTAREGTCDLKDFFAGFQYFVWSFLAYLLICLFFLIGVVFLIVPGLVILGMYLYTFHFIVDQEKDFWQAMESSRQFVARDYFGFTLLALVLGGLNFLGLCFFGVGVLISLPVTALALTAAFEGTTPTPAESRSLPAPQTPVVIE